MPPQPQVLVNTIRAFEGPRHTLLERCWDTYAETNAQRMRYMCHSNAGARLSHAKMLNSIWNDFVLFRPERYIILTELDFLPSPDFIKLTYVDSAYPILAATYCTREPGTNTMKEHSDIVGAWYICVDREYVDKLDFSPGGPFNDPANNLVSYIHDEYGLGVRMLMPADCMPRHYGVQYLTGEHLFWSRHYNDHPDSDLGGFRAGEIQKKVDQAITAWTNNQSNEFKRVFHRVGGATALETARASAPFDLRTGKRTG